MEPTDATSPCTRAMDSENGGAAEEPGPEPDGSLSSSSTIASYDPTVFQRPHPDDRGGANDKARKKGGGDGAGKAGAQSKGELKGNDRGKGKSSSKGKSAPSLDRCGWCDTEGASRTCSQCRSVVYCSPACQKVSRT